jgi:hypothetical protein
MLVTRMVDLALWPGRDWSTLETMRGTGHAGGDPPANAQFDSRYRRIPRGCSSTPNEQPNEILVKAVEPLRFAEARGQYANVLHMLSSH